MSKLITAATVMAIFLLAVPGPALADGAPATLPALPTQIMSPVFDVSPGGDIQAAVDAAYEAGGGTVNLASGRFDITAPIIPRSNVTIQGQGSTGSGITTIYNALGANMVIMVDGRSGGLKNVTFQHFKIDCGLSRTQRSYASDPGKNYGIFVTDTSASNDLVLFDDIQITQCLMGLHSKGTSDLTIRDSNFHDDGGVLYYSHDVYLRRVSKADIENSILSDSSTANGLNISYSDNITVQNCTASSNYFRGIRAADSSNIDVLSNTVSGNGDAGIIMNSETAGVDQFRIIGNKVTSNSVGISTSSNSSNGSVWSNAVSGNGTNLSINSSSTSIKIVACRAGSVRKVMTGK
ncbi:right-handed parallel beta-helix repeat-containing protein [Streptomyces sp. NPDC051665]|uniref:right-handed parallel beta-helix repeat-containing protein n=1 Tax=Streptomyces sp. NPDC051665 TaxID=3154647 RepID=UPI003448C39E